jgi:DNA gyrase subunit A
MNVIMVTQQGTIKKTTLEAYSRPRLNGINSMNVREGDQLVEARLTNGTCEMVIASRNGKAIRFNESTVRPMGRSATGVRAIRLAEGDEVIGMVSIDKNDLNDSQILVVTENGYGKRTKLVDDDGVDVYRITNRGGKGVKTLNITEKTGALIAINNVTDADDLMIINKSGLTIRMLVSDLRVMGRATQGVRLINIKGTDSIAAVTKVLREEESDELLEDFEGDVENNFDDEIAEETEE